MRVYISDLESYERGFLVGAWLEFPMSVKELNEKIKDVNFEGQKACNNNFLHEEFFISDYVADMEIEEDYNIYVLNEIAKALEGFSEDELLKFKILVNEAKSERNIIEKGLESY
jgi:hypothetical protein